MTPEYLCSAAATERDKAIACKSAFHTLKRHVEWPELLGHLEYMRHAIVRWGSCDTLDSRIHAFLRHDDTRTLAAYTFANNNGTAARPFPFARIVPANDTTITEPFPLGVSLHTHYTRLSNCFDELATIDAMTIDTFSKTLWKDTIRSKCSYLETLDLLAQDLTILFVRCSKILVYATILFKEAQRYVACDPSEDARTLVEWSQRMCGTLDGIVASKPEPCTYVEKDDAASYMATVCGIHNAIKDLYAPLSIASCPVNSPLEFPCRFMMDTYNTIVNLTRLHPIEE